uniref:LOW QUALITY PROTEIN: olfactory receptor 8D1-like n=1 Tax=Ictidomys tridecemlineatus TaxID=43179 RepID=UPI0006812FF6
LLGLTQQPELQLPLFLLFLGIYMVSVGNLSMSLLIAASPLLHTPMYYFLSCFSFIDLCSSTIITPKMLVNFVKKNTILYSECIAQLFFFAEGYLLTAMTYDHYVAICSPLLYNVTMSPWLCSLLVLIAFILGVLSAVTHTSAMMKVSFCKSHIINHYFCDVLPLLNLSCSSTHLSELLLFVVAGVNSLVPTLAVAISYAFIFYSILHIHSSEGRSKAFGTCRSHLIAVGIFIGSITFMYFNPLSSNSLDQVKVSSLFYTTVIPMLNPLIYSLRNKDVKKALRKVLMKRFSMGMTVLWKHRGHLLLDHAAAACWLEIHKYDGPIEDPNICQMKAKSTKGFGPALN